MEADMEIAYHTVNTDLSAGDREQIERELARVEDFVKHFPRPTYHLEVERSPRKGGYGVSLHVNLSTRSLFATAWGGDLRTAIEVGTDKIVRQAKKHLDRLRKDERAGAETPRSETFFGEPTAADLQTIRDLEDFRDHIASHAARLNGFLRRELRLLRRGGRSIRGVSLPDVVEDAITYVFEHFREKPKNLSPDRWLVRRGLLILHEELDRARGGDESPTPAPAASPEIPEDWEELMGLTGPEAVPMDGQPADEARASPEILRERGRAQTETAEALARLPDRLRQSLVLRHLEGYQVPEIAYVLNTDEAQVESWLDEAEVSMQDQLRNWRRL
jgi:ribosomal subunit interface protein